MPVRIKRVYLPPETTDGYRILVDRLWPRGIKKDELTVDSWLKETAPSNELRKWFNHDPSKWESFKQKYKKELAKNPAFYELKMIIKEHETVTLLFSAKDEEHNQAKALLEILGILHAA